MHNLAPYVSYVNKDAVSHIVPLQAHPVLVSNKCPGDSVAVKVHNFFVRRLIRWELFRHVFSIHLLVHWIQLYYLLTVQNFFAWKINYFLHYDFVK